MKIMYLSFNEPLKGLGVYKKELSLCKTLYFAALNKGHSFRGVNVVIDNNNKLFMDKHYEVISYSKLKFLSKIPIIRSLANYLIKKYIAFKEIKKYNPDILIFRYIWLPFVFNPKKVKKDMLFLTEHQTKEEYELSVSLLKKLTLKPIESFNFKKLFKSIDGIIGVTKEIAEYEIKRGKVSKPTFVLTNGIDVEQYPPKKFVKFNDRLNIIFVTAFYSSWHGFDRILYGLKKFYDNGNSLDIFIYVVGDVKSGYENMALNLNLKERIIFCGTKYNKELNQIFDICHIGLGPLAIHRKNLEYASPIKVREYLARGMPVIIGYKDEDIEDDFPFVLKVSSDDSPVDIQNVVDFCKNIYDNYGEKMIYEIRNYAKNKLDYSVKITKLVDFLEKLNIKNKKKEL